MIYLPASALRLVGVLSTGTAYLLLLLIRSAAARQSSNFFERKVVRTEEDRFL